MNRKSTPTPRLRRTGKIILISILSVLIVAGGILVFSRGVFKAKPVEQKTDLAESIDDFNIDPQDQLNYKNEIIPLLWEDNNDGENLIIKTDRQYYDAGDETEIFFSVANTTSQDQNAEIIFWFDGRDKQIEDVEKIVKGENSELSIFNEFSIPQFSNRKSVKGYTAGSKFEDKIVAGQTNYYRAIAKFPKGANGEFFIETFGIPAGCSDIFGYSGKTKNTAISSDVSANSNEVRDSRLDINLSIASENILSSLFVDKRLSELVGGFAPPKSRIPSLDSHSVTGSDLSYHNQNASKIKRDDEFKWGANIAHADENEQDSGNCGITAYGHLDPYYASGLVGNWTFNGPDTTWTSATAGTTNDLSGSGNTGTMTNMSRSSSPAPGVSGQALNFDGTDDYVDLGNPTALQLTGSATWVAWVKEDVAAPAAAGAIVSKRGLESDNTGWYLGQDGGSAYRVSVTQSVATASRYSGTVPATGRWYHVAGVYDASAQTLDIYVNGALDNGTLSGTVPSSQSNSGLNANIGRKPVNNSYEDGLIDEVRIYNRALSQSEITELYRLGAARMKINTPITQRGAQSGLVGNWTFNGQDIDWASTTLDESFTGSTFPPTVTCDSPGWTTGGNANWARDTGTYDTSPAAAASGAILDNQSTWIDCNVTLSAASTLSFSWKVSSEDTYDFLQFCYDNDGCTLGVGYDQRISGEVGFTTVTKEMTAGTHSLRWLYAKDVNTIGGSDKGWIDTIKIVNSIAVDRSGQGNNGTIINGATPAPGISGQALSFDGTDDYVSITNSSSLDFGTGNFSFSAWVKTTQNCSGNKVYMSEYESDAQSIWLGCVDSGGVGKAFFSTRDSNVVTVGSGNSITTINDNKWHHLLGVRNGDNVYIYVDGASENSGTGSRTGNFDFVSPAYIGRHAGSYYAAATIDEVRVYNRALSQSEITELYRLGAARMKINTPITQRGAQSGLVGNWTFNGPDMSTSVSTLVGSELIVNGTFDSNISGWTTDVGGSTISWQNALSGDGSTGYMRFNIADNADYDRFRKDGDVVSASTSYRISFWYRTSGITGNLKAFFTDDFGTLANTVWGPNLTPSASWQLVSFDLATNSLSYPIFGISKLGSIGSGTFDVDAISVKEITDTTTIIALDRSGQGNDGTLTNGPTPAPGISGQALNFDGVNDYVVSPHTGMDKDVGTLSMWIKPDVALASLHYMFDSDTARHAYYGTSDGTTITMYNDGRDRRFTISSYTAGQWYHIVFVWNKTSDTQKIYWNGVEQSVSLTQGTWGSNNIGTNIYIGTRFSATELFDGLIDEVRVYNRTLTSDEILQLYQLGNRKVEIRQ